MMDLPWEASGGFKKQWIVAHGDIKYRDISRPPRQVACARQIPFVVTAALHGRSASKNLLSGSDLSTGWSTAKGNKTKMAQTQTRRQPKKILLWDTKKYITLHNNYIPSHETGHESDKYDKCHDVLVLAMIVLQEFFPTNSVAQLASSFILVVSNLSALLDSPTIMPHTNQQRGTRKSI